MNEEEDNYFNSINHYILITPNIKSILWKFKSNEFLSIVNSINIENLWFNNEENFKFKDIDIYQFFKLWNLNLKQLQKYEILNQDICLIGFDS